MGSSWAAHGPAREHQNAHLHYIDPVLCTHATIFLQAKFISTYLIGCNLHMPVLAKQDLLLQILHLFHAKLLGTSIACLQTHDMSTYSHARGTSPRQSNPSPTLLPPCHFASSPDPGYIEYISSNPSLMHLFLAEGHLSPPIKPFPRLFSHHDMPREAGLQATPIPFCFQPQHSSIILTCVASLLTKPNPFIPTLLPPCNLTYSRASGEPDS